MARYVNLHEWDNSDLIDARLLDHSQSTSILEGWGLPVVRTHVYASDEKLEKFLGEVPLALVISSPHDRNMSKTGMAGISSVEAFREYRQKLDGNHDHVLIEQVQGEQESFVGTATTLDGMTIIEVLREPGNVDVRTITSGTTDPAQIEEYIIKGGNLMSSSTPEPDYRMILSIAGYASRDGYYEFCYGRLADNSVSLVFTDYQSSPIFKGLLGRLDSVTEAGIINALEARAQERGDNPSFVFSRHPTSGKSGLHKLKGGSIAGAEGMQDSYGLIDTESESMTVQLGTYIGEKLQSAEAFISSMSVKEMILEDKIKASGPAALRRAPIAVLAYLIRNLDRPRCVPDGPVIARGKSLGDNQGSGKLVSSVEDAEQVAASGGKAILVTDVLMPRHAGILNMLEGVVTTKASVTGHQAVIIANAGLANLFCSEIAVTEDGIRIGQRDVRYQTTVSIGPGELSLGDLRIADKEGKETPETINNVLDMGGLGFMLSVDQARILEDPLYSLASGVGLYRTEHSLIHDKANMESLAAYIRSGDPGQLRKLQEALEEEYIQLIGLSKGKDTCIRLWDLLTHEIDALGIQEQNPMMGLRGIRLSYYLPELYEVQLKAIAGAVRRSPSPRVSIMLPFVNSKDEVDHIKEMLRACPVDVGDDISLGAMIETPAACLNIAEIASCLDFVSIGMNDLSQFTYAVSRDDKDMEHFMMYMEGQGCPMLEGEARRFLARTISSARASGAEVCICGDYPYQGEDLFFFRDSGAGWISTSVTQFPSLLAAFIKDSCKLYTDQ